MLIAKPVVDKQFWILQEDNRKVGNVQACDGGYQVNINNQITQYKTIRMVAQRVNVQFESAPKIARHQPTTDLVHNYPASGRVYNPVWNVAQHLPVYTQTSKSKSWFAAGWYLVRKGRVWQTVLSPKLIVLQRYTYQGPFYTEQQANDHSSTEIR
jgi:hypothetical protein